MEVQGSQLKEKMQLDVDIEPALEFSGMTSIGKQIDQSESKADCLTDSAICANCTGGLKYDA